MIFGGAFSELTDRRAARGKRYALEPLLCSILLAMLAGATSLRKMEAFIATQLEPLNRLFGTRWKKAPSWVGIRRFLLEIDETELETACRTHAKRQMPRSIDGLQFIAMDGKALRGSASRVLDVRAKQLVSAFAHDDLIVLGHIEVDEKSNEIPAVQTLIASMGLPGRVFTLDALHCQKKTLTCAVACGAHVMVQVKGNQPDLLAACVSLMDRCAATQEHVQVDKGHGRIETRIVQTYTPVSGWLPDGWSEVLQIVRVSRAVERKESSGIWKTSHETACWISTIALSAAICQTGIRGHWCVENQNHHVRDVTLREDYCRVRLKPAILARLRSVCLNCMRACDVVNMAVAVFRNALNFDALVAMARKT